MSANGDEVYALASVLGHEPECCTKREEGDGECTPDWPDCSLWETASLILRSSNLNELLAMAWQRGFEACQQRTANELLALLPQVRDTTNPFSGEELSS
jgi:hypothetical protein